MRRRFSPMLLAVALLAPLPLAGCERPAGEEAGGSGQPERIAQAADEVPDDCLVVIWEKQDAPDRAFDRERDRAEGGAISCATSSSASQFEAAIRAIKDSAEAGDRAALLKEIGVPMLYIDGEGKPREIGDEAALDEAFDEIFTPEMLEMLGRLELDRITVVPNEGAFFEFGSLWLVVPEPGARPRIVTVNAQALSEAAEAAKAARQKAAKAAGAEE